MRSVCAQPGSIVLVCGILGVRRSVAADPERLAAAREAMAWRGPDGTVAVDTGGWHLAVARLTITDPAHGQPLWSADGERVVLFNGTVASAGEERERFADQLETGNDAELLLHRLAAEGGAGLVRTRGHYAAAVLEPATGRLWLVRDPEGEKPLYVLRRGDEVVAFASTAASLRRLGFALRLPDVDVARFLRFGFFVEPRAVDPGFTLDADLRGGEQHGPAGAIDRFARPGATMRTAMNTPTPASLRQALVDTVARMACAEVPVGLCLSGGLDSSCLAVAAAATGAAPLPAYQLRAAGTDGEERARARAVVEITGAELRPVDVGPEILQALPALTRHIGWPLGDPSVLAVHALARAAAADGIRVLLSGEGADELFLGYRRHRAAQYLPRNGLPLLGGNGVGTGTRRRMWRALCSRHPYESLLEVSPPGFRSRVLVPVLVDGHLPHTESLSPSRLDRARSIDRAFYLRHDLLPKLDTATMAAGIEGRCPYLDPAITESRCAQAPASSQLGKRALRAAFASDLPAAVRRGRKRGFSLPLDEWWRVDDYLPDLLLERRSLERGHLCAAGVREMLDRHRARRLQVGHALYLLVAYELYLRELEELPPT